MAARTCAYAAHHMFGRYDSVMASMFQEHFVLIGTIPRCGTSIGVSHCYWLSSRLTSGGEMLQAKELSSCCGWRWRWEGAIVGSRSQGIAKKVSTAFCKFCEDCPV